MYDTDHTAPPERTYLDGVHDGKLRVLEIIELIIDKEPPVSFMDGHSMTGREAYRKCLRDIANCIRRDCPTLQQIVGDFVVAETDRLMMGLVDDK